MKTANPYLVIPSRTRKPVLIVKDGLLVAHLKPSVFIMWIPLEHFSSRSLVPLFRSLLCFAAATLKAYEIAFSSSVVPRRHESLRESLRYRLLVPSVNATTQIQPKGRIANG